MRKRKQAAGIILAATLTAMLFAGCQKSPDTEIVHNKDFDNMIEQAENTEASTTEVQEVAADYDKYQTDFEDTGMHVKVHVDAQVDIPQTEKLSIFRVKQKKIDQAFADQVQTYFFGDQTLYEGKVLGQMLKSEWSLDSIDDNNEWMEEIKNSNAYTAEQKEALIADLEESNRKTLEEYEKAPETFSIEGTETDRQFHSIADLYAAHPDDTYYSWQNDFDGANAEIIYEINDAKNGHYQSIYIQNNDNYGNMLKYRSSRAGYYDVGHSVMGIDPYCKVDEDYRFATAGTTGAYIHPIEAGSENDSFLEKTTISEAEAKEQAETFLKDMGLTDYAFYNGGLVKERLDTRNVEELKEANHGQDVYRSVYAFRYQRCIDGVFVNNDGGSKIVDEFRGDSYVKKIWDAENIAIFVNDDGIVGFDYLIPLEVTETVVDQSTLKSFDEIKDVFEQMIVTTNAAITEDQYTYIDINNVKLRYSRISEPDNFDTGVLVPVWDFIGTRTDVSGDEEKDIVLLSINAIDGTVIDKDLGY